MPHDAATDTLVRLFGELAAMSGKKRQVALAVAHQQHPGLTTELVSLLSALEQSDAGLTSHMANALGDDPQTAEAELLPGIRVGRFEIVAELGRGGMGIVYRARRVDGMIYQNVAIKISRFRPTNGISLFGLEKEAALLSTLRHPSIARFHDVVKIDDGRLALIVDLVEGQTVDTWCAENQPNMDELLRILLEIAQAVRHAHGERVTHGDIKPGNVMVDGQGHVRLLDFGIATLFGESDLGSVRAVGVSPGYSAPEVFEKGLVSARSDIYSLGVLGRELLASVPVAIETTSRYSRSKDLVILLEAAANPDYAKRLADMGAMVSDLQAIAECRPISQRPHERVYRMARFCQRRPSLVGLSLLTLLALLVGIIGTSLAQRDSQRRAMELKRVVQFQEDQLSQIDPSAMGSSLRRALVTEHRNAYLYSRVAFAHADSRAADADAERFENDLAGVNFTDIALKALQGDIFDRALAAIDGQFSNEPQIKARLLQTVAESLKKLGLYDRALPPQREALDIRRASLGSDHPDTFASMNSLGTLLGLRGELPESISLLETALTGRKRVLGVDNPDTLESMASLGSIKRMLANSVTSVEPLVRDTLQRRQRALGDGHRSTLSSMLELVLVLLDQKKLAEAESFARELLRSSQRQFGEQDTDSLRYANILGTVLMEVEKYDEARTLLERTSMAHRRRYGNEHETTLTSISKLCSLNIRQGRLAEAEPLCREAVDTYRRIFGPVNSGTITATNNLATLKFRQGKFDDAERYLRESAQASRRSLGNQHPDTLLRLANLANLQRKLNRLDESMQLLDEVVEGATLMLPADHLNMAFYRLSRARTLARRQRFSEAETEIINAWAIAARVLPPTHLQRLETIRGLVEIYDAWEKAEPGNGHAAQANEWRPQLSSDQSLK